MAKDYEINLKVNTGSSVNDLNDLENVLSDIGDELVPLTSQMGEMEDKLMLMAYAGDTTSEEFKKLSHEVAGMRRSIRETDAGLEALSMTTAQKLGGALGGVTAGFETFQGAMGAFGVESEQVEKALLKVQSAMALTQGIAGIREALPSFTALKTGIVDGFNQMSSAGKAFTLTGIGLMVTAIGGAIAYFDDLTGSFSNVSAEQKILNDTQEDYTKGATAAAEVTAEVGSKFELAKKGVISKEEALQYYNDTLGDSFGKANNLNDAEQIFQDKTQSYVKAAGLRAQAQSLIAKSAEAGVKLLQAEEAAAKKTNEGGIASALGITAAFKGVKDAAVESLKEQKQTLEDQAARLLTEAQNLEKSSGIITQSQIDNNKKLEEAAAAAEEKRKERAAAQKQWLEEQKSILAEITKANLDYQNEKKSEEEQEVIASQEKWDALITDAKKYKLDTTQLLLNKEEEEKTIRKKYADEQIQAEKDKQDALNKVIKEAAQNNLQAREDFDALLYEATTSAQQQELDAVGEKYFYLIEMAKQYGLDTTQLEADRLTKEAEINKKYAEEKKAADQKILDDQKAATQKENDLRIQAASDTFTTLNNLTTLFAGKSEKAQKRAFQIQKAVSIAQAVIDTYKAANVALASSPPPFNYIAMAAAITTGLVNVKTIMAQKFEGAGTSGGGTTSPSSAGGGTTNVMTPNFNVVGNSGINQLAQVAGQPIQAYVVSGQITTAQSLDRNKIENATL